MIKQIHFKLKNNDTITLDMNIPYLTIGDLAKQLRNINYTSYKRLSDNKYIFYTVKKKYPIVIEFDYSWTGYIKIWLNDTIDKYKNIISITSENINNRDATLNIHDFINLMLMNSIKKEVTEQGGWTITLDYIPSRYKILITNHVFSTSIELKCVL